MIGKIGSALISTPQESQPISLSLPLEISPIEKTADTGNTKGNKENPQKQEQQDGKGKYA